MAFTKHKFNDVVFHTSNLFSSAGGVAHGFATKLGGVSTGHCSQLNLGLSRGDSPDSVRENYRRFCEATGTDLHSIVMTKQVHKDEIRKVSKQDILPELLAPIPYEADGLITNEPGFCLTIFYADCIPVFLYDPVLKVIAAVHSGWRGTAAGIAPKAVQMMVQDYGCDSNNILAAIGPGIGPCCFETHSDVPDAMLSRWGESIRPFLHTLENGKFGVDLKGIIRFNLLNTGLSESNIDVLPLCTGCNLDLYWSHRKLGTNRGNQAAMLQLTTD